MIWDTQDPYLYMRTTDDGRFLVGGEDSVYKIPILQQNIKEEKIKNLLKTQKNLPDLDFIEDISWVEFWNHQRWIALYWGISRIQKLFVLLRFLEMELPFLHKEEKNIVDLLQKKENALVPYYRFGR